MRRPTPTHSVVRHAAVVAVAVALAAALLAAIAPPAAAVAEGGAPPDPAALQAKAKEAALRHYLQGVLLEQQGNIHEAIAQIGRAFQYDPTAPDLAVKLADLSLQRGDAQGALDMARRAIALGDATGEGHFLAGTALGATNRVREAAAEFRQAVAADSLAAQRWHALGRAHEDLGELADAAAAYRRACALEPENAEVAFRLATLEARAGRMAAADSLLTRVEELNPFQPGLALTRAWVADAQGRLAEAVTAYEQHLKFFPNDRGSRRRLVNAYIGLDDRPRALQHARILLDQQPDDFDAGRVLTSLHLRLGQTDRAVEVAKELRRRLRGDPEAAAFAIGVLQFAQRGDEARAVADAVTEEAPADYRAWLVAGEAYAGGEPGERPSAEADRRFARARELLPDSTAARLTLARTLGRTRRLAAAEEVLRTALERTPEDAQVWLELAFNAERRKDVAAAEGAAQRALELAPEDARALNFLGYLYADYEVRLDRAVPLIERALALDPDNPFYIDSLGWAYFRLGRLEEARVALERALRLGGEDPEIYEHLGDVYRALSRKQDAKSQYRKALELNPGNDAVARKLAELR